MQRSVSGLFQHIVATFGEDRLMFGSDWPLCRLSHIDLPQVYELAQQLLQKMSPGAKEKVFSKNAIKFYNIKL